ncbi:MAG: hypothetical protein ACR2P9_07490 [Gammaproteobacteria bacterium]
MSFIAELNDSNVAVANGTEIITQSPGVAVLLNDKLELGQRALGMARLYPQNTHSRFWSELSLDKLKTTTTLARHNADLAFAHLRLIHEQAGKPETMVFAVPGSLSDEQLSLLAGLIEAAPFGVTSMVDAAVAAVAGKAMEGHCQYVDVALHQTVITELQVTDSVKRLDVKVIDDTGLSTVYDRCADVIAGLFIEQSRFDPLHHAETEQALYDLLPGCLEALQQRDEVSLEINYQQTRYQTRLNKQALMPALSALHETIGKTIRAATSGDYLLLNHRGTIVPGLRAQLGDSLVVDHRAVFRGATLLPSATGGELHFASEIKLNAKPVRSAAAKKKLATNTDIRPAATHLLIGHAAWPVTPDGLHLAAGEPPLRNKHHGIDCVFRLQQQGVVLDCDAAADIRLNGEPVSGSRELHSGDDISTPQTDTIRAIRVLTGHG